MSATRDPWPRREHRSAARLEASRGCLRFHQAGSRQRGRAPTWVSRPKPTRCARAGPPLSSYERRAIANRCELEECVGDTAEIDDGDARYAALSHCWSGRALSKRPLSVQGHARDCPVPRTTPRSSRLHRATGRNARSQRSLCLRRSRRWAIANPGQQAKRLPTAGCSFPAGIEHTRALPARACSARSRFDCRTFGDTRARATSSGDGVSDHHSNERASRALLRDVRRDAS